MELILATSDGREERTVNEDIDIEIGSENTFEIEANALSWDGSFGYGKLVYEPGTEHGGIIKDIESSTVTDSIFVRGYTWRGYLAHRIIVPPAGEDYKVVSGELNAIIAEVLGSSLGSLFRVADQSTGVSINSYSFDRYTTAEAGLSKMLNTVGYRLQIRYIQTEFGGYVEIGAVEAINHVDVDISQDSGMDFSSRDYRMGVNHLICLGTGELKDRIVVDLYCDKDGNISRTKSISGLDEIVEIFENTTAEEEDLITTGTDRFQTLLNYKSFKAQARNIDDINLQLGDTITGRDYITGNVVTKPIISKIVKRTEGLLTVDYRISGEE